MKKIFCAFIATLALFSILPTHANADTYGPWIFVSQEYVNIWSMDRLLCVYKRRVYATDSPDYWLVSSNYYIDRSICPATP